MGIEDAAHAESSDGGTPIVTALRCSLVGETITVRLREGSALRRLHGGAATAAERTACSYGLSPRWQAAIDQSGLGVVATGEAGACRAVERADHPFFIGTLYLPQLQPDHPVFAGLIAAARRRAGAARG